jgi:hypothetical protein
MGMLACPRNDKELFYGHYQCFDVFDNGWERFEVFLQGLVSFKVNLGSVSTGELAPDGHELLPRILLIFFAFGWRGREIFLDVCGDVFVDVPHTKICF